MYTTDEHVTGGNVYRLNDNNTNMKQHKSYNILLILALAFGLIACSNDHIDPVIQDNGVYQSRIDLAIVGGINNNYYLQGNEGLMTLGYGNEESRPESVINLEISKYETLELVIRSASIEQPLHVPYLYSAFSEMILPMRDTYVIANFYNKGELVYSTSNANAAEDHIQTYVLEIIATNDQNLMARFHDMQLFPVHDYLISRESIVIAGTFTTAL